MNRLKDLFDKNVRVEYAQTDIIPNQYGNTKALFFESVPYCGRETTTFAYMGTPNGEKPNGGFPAVVLVHGGGGCAFYEWVEYWNGKGYVALAFDTGGRQFGGREHDSKDTAEQNPLGRYVKPDDNGSFGNDGDSVCDSWTYHNVANVILANNILRSNENVNRGKIVLTGISWGGVLTAITSGIDQRFAAFSPVYGTGYLLQSQVFTKNKVPVPNDFKAWTSIYDPTVFVQQNKKPMLFTLGMDDAAFSPKNGQRTYEKSQGKMYYSFRHALPHYSGHIWDEGIVTADSADSAEIKTYTCTVCQFKKTENMSNAESHVHSFSSEWSKDAEVHWHKSTCEHTDQISSYGKHMWDGGTITIEPTYNADGVKTYICVVCGVQKAETVDRLVKPHEHTYRCFITLCLPCLFYSF